MSVQSNTPEPDEYIFLFLSGKDIFVEGKKPFLEEHEELHRKLSKLAPRPRSLWKRIAKDKAISPSIELDTDK